MIKETCQFVDVPFQNYDMQKIVLNFFSEIVLGKNRYSRKLSTALY